MPTDCPHREKLGYGGDIVTTGVTYNSPAGAGGSWAGNVYTCDNAGTWTFTATYGSDSATADLIVTTDTTSAPSSVTIAPDEAAIDNTQTQTYTVSATDPCGNVWTPTPVAADWVLTDLDGAFDDANTFTPTAGSASIGSLHVVVNGVSSNEAALTVRRTGTTNPGEGTVVAWDKDTQKMYLCSDPANPQAGLEMVRGTHTGTIGGEDVTYTLTSAASQLQAVVTNCGVTNALKVRWYMRGSSLYRVYFYSTIGAVNTITTYTGGNTLVNGGTMKTGFWGIGHQPTGYSAGAWSSMVQSATEQP
mgnify:CR=1 FL=1